MKRKGKRHLGAAIGSQDFKIAHANEKVNSWCEEITKLTEYANSHPQASCAAYRHGEIHKCTYFIHVMKEYLKPLDEMISNTFIPALLQSVDPWIGGVMVSALYFYSPAGRNVYKLEI